MVSKAMTEKKRNPKRRGRPAGKNRRQRSKFVHSSGGIVYAIIDGVPKLLLIKHSFDGAWAIPKGHIDPGEDSKTAGVREVQEETGITAEIVELLGKNTYHFRGLRGPEKGKTVRKTVDLYLMRAMGDTELDPEKFDPHDQLVADARWFDPDEAVRAIPHANLRRLVAQAAKRSKELTHGA